MSRNNFPTDEAYLAEINKEMRFMGLKACATLADATRTNRVAGDVPVPEKTYGPRGDGNGSAAVKLASPKQLEWLVKLAHRATDEATVKTTAKAVNNEAVSAKAAHLALDILFSLPRETAPKPVQIDPKPAAVKASPVVEEGIYRKGTALFKVQTSKSSGRLYALVWTLFETPTPTAKGLKYGEFVYAAGMINKLTADDRMTLEEAKAFGIEFHFCIRCGIELTNPDSISVGVGPICITKY